MLRITTHADEQALAALLLRIVRRRDEPGAGPIDEVELERLHHDPRHEEAVSSWGRPGDLVACAVDGDDQVVGAAWARRPDHGPGRVWVAVHPPHRRSGVGRLLVATLAARAGTAGWPGLLAVVERADPATALFVMSGFTVTHADPPNVVMELGLTTPGAAPVPALTPTDGVPA